MKRTTFIYTIVVILFTLFGVSFFINPGVGIAVGSLIGIPFLIAALYEKDRKMKQSLLIYSILPLLTSIVPGLPFGNILLKAFTLYILLLILSVWYQYVMKMRTNKAFTASVLPIVLIFAVVAGYLSSKIPVTLHMHMPIIAAIAYILVVSYTEILFFQGLLQRITESIHGRGKAIILATLTYGIFHATTHISTTIMLTLLGLTYALSYSWKKNIYLTALLSVLISLAYFIFTKGSVLPF